MREDFILRALSRRPFLIQFLLHQPFIFMKKKTGGRKVKQDVIRCDQAVDIEHWNLMVATAYRYFRVGVRQISLAEAERRSGLSHQFWTMVETGECSPNGISALKMCYALQTTPSAVQEMAELWMELRYEDWKPKREPRPEDLIPRSRYPKALARRKGRGGQSSSQQGAFCPLNSSL